MWEADHLSEFRMGKKCSAENISHDRKRQKAVREPRRGSSKCCGWQVHLVLLRRNGARVARLAQQGSDILGRPLSRAAKETQRQPRPDPSLCWTHGHAGTREQGPMCGVCESERTLDGRPRLVGRLGCPLQPCGCQSLHTSALGQAG